MYYSVFTIAAIKNWYVISIYDKMLQGLPPLVVWFQTNWILTQFGLEMNLMNIYCLLVETMHGGGILQNEMYMCLEECDFGDEI